jgi:hypothetical protein
MAALEIGGNRISFCWNPSSIYRVVGAHAWCCVASGEGGCLVARRVGWVQPPGPCGPCDWTGRRMGRARSSDQQRCTQVQYKYIVYIYTHTS